jgi:isopenicillin-N epimerase
MDANHALVVEGRDIVADALGIDRPAPDDMLGSMAALPVSGVADDAAAEALGRALETEDGIQVPVGGWPARAARDPRAPAPAAVLIRISAQRYNESSDYERLAAALVRRLGRRGSAG